VHLFGAGTFSGLVLFELRKSKVAFEVSPVSLHQKEVLRESERQEVVLAFDFYGLLVRCQGGEQEVLKCSVRST
jgi:hypothetical protein